MLFSFLFAPLNFALVFRWNIDWGVPDLALIIFSDVVGDVLF